ncbi:hypothetical protein QR680_015020 [Steinernema hermaphroditum]|uniref:Uncharacterized protein n=1 Tax=Steinernema hermaphroditum TaxID=289476 RepID=A0AA39M584_9BILA|nr:hypothetical protein QR680_015020 [Steinernema hermaphroditum]
MRDKKDTERAAGHIVRFRHNLYPLLYDRTMNCLPYRFIESVMLRLCNNDDITALTTLEGLFGYVGRRMVRDRFSAHFEGKVELVQNCASKQIMDSFEPRFCASIKIYILSGNMLPPLSVATIKNLQQYARTTTLMVQARDLPEELLSVLTDIRVTEIALMSEPDNSIRYLAQTLIQKGQLRCAGVHDKFMEDRNVELFFPTLFQPQFRTLIFAQCDERIIELVRSFLEGNKKEIVGKCVGFQEPNEWTFEDFSAAFEGFNLEEGNSKNKECRVFIRL